MPLGFQRDAKNPGEDESSLVTVEQHQIRGAAGEIQELMKLLIIDDCLEVKIKGRKFMFPIMKNKNPKSQAQRSRTI